MDKLGYILMADDSDNDLELAQRVLMESRLANEVITVHDGAEALDFLYRRGSFSSRAQGNPMMVLLDVNMPKVNGFEVLAKMKGDPQLSSIPVIMLTSSRQGPDVDECYRLHSNAYVVKPVDFEQFTDVVCAIGKFWAVLNEVPHGVKKTAAAHV